VKPDFQINEIGNAIKFECESDHQPTWLLNGEKLPIDVSSVKGSKKRVFELKILSVEKKHAGIYTCNGRDHGDVYFESTGELVIEGKWRIEYQ